MTRIKICGLTRLADIEAVNSAKPDYIGFVFAESRRRVTPQQARELRGKLRGGIIPVGVFVDEAIENILGLLREDVIEIIQLHGAENDEYIRELKQHTNAPVIKAVSVRSAGDIPAQTSADYLLPDSGSGGTGSTFDWGLLGKAPKPIFLAGGLNAENVSDAIAATAPFAVDTSSGVETDGLKNPAKIHEFIRRVRHG